MSSGLQRVWNRPSRIKKLIARSKSRKCVYPTPNIITDSKNQFSWTLSLVEFHEGLSQTLVCIFFRMLFVAGLAHEVRACTFHYLGPKVLHFHMSFLLLQSCFFVNPPYMMMTCISGAAPSWTWAWCSVAVHVWIILWRWGDGKDI